MSGGLYYQRSINNAVEALEKDRDASELGMELWIGDAAEKKLCRLQWTRNLPLYSLFFRVYTRLHRVGPSF